MVRGFLGSRLVGRWVVGMLMLGYNDDSVGCGLFSVASNRMVTRNNVRGVNLPNTFLGLASGSNGGIILRGRVPNRGRNVRFVLDVLASGACNYVGRCGRVSTINRHIMRKNRGFTSDIGVSQSIVGGMVRYSSLTPLRGPTGLGKVSTVRTLVPNVPRMTMFSATFRRAVPTGTCVCNLPCRVCAGCNIHHCNFRKADRHCISHHTYRVLNIPCRRRGVVATRMNGNNSVTTMSRNGYISASVKLAPIRNLLVNAHYNSMSTNTLSFVVRGRKLSNRNLSSLVGGGDKITNLINNSSSVHSLRTTMRTNSRHTAVILSICGCHVGGCVNTCTTTVNNYSVLI